MLSSFAATMLIVAVTQANKCDRCIPGAVSRALRFTGARRLTAYPLG
jgi:hypothetical protein